LGADNFICFLLLPLIQFFFNIHPNLCTMKLLLIEDEPELAGEIINYLSGHGFRCEWAKNLEDALEKVAVFEYDSILLDLMLPDGSGFKVLKELKNQQKTEGVIIISAKESIENIVEGLQSGADDYLTKPFHLPELLARIQALIRRKNFTGSNSLQFNEISIDLLSKEVRVNQNKIELTKREFDLLLFLVGNKRRVLSKQAIAEHLSGDMADLMVSYDFVYAHIKNLKRKLSEAGGEDYIKTVYGIGYKWQA